MNPAAPNPVVWMFVTDILSGVTSWALRLREAVRRQGRCLELVACNTTAARSPGFDHYVNSRRAVRRLLAKQPDATVIPNYLWEVFDLAREHNAKTGRHRIVAFCHADSEREYYTPLAWYAAMSSVLVAVSERCADQLRARLPERPVPIVPYGVHVLESPPPPREAGPLRLLYAGRLAVEQKRVLDLIELCDALLDRGVDFQLDLVGKGPAEPALRSASSVTRRRDRLRLLGSLAPARMQTLYADYDLIVLVSEFEGTSNSLLEGMGHGLVPAVTRTASGLDGVVVDGVDAVVEPIGEMRRLADRIAQLEAEPARLARMRLSAHAAARRFDIAENARRLLEIVDAAEVPPVSRERRHGRPPLEGEILGTFRRFVRKQARKLGLWAPAPGSR